MASVPVRVRRMVRGVTIAMRLELYRRVWGMDIGEGCRISHKALLDKANPRGIHIGRYTGVAFGAAILSHDFVHNRHLDTWIGERCHVGAGAIIYPGIRIGDGCLIAAGSVVTRDVPEGSIVVGNPARVVEKGLRTGKWGVRTDILPPERLDTKLLMN